MKGLFSVVMIAALSLSACKKQRPKIEQASDSSFDFGRREAMRLIEDYANSKRTPGDFRKMYYGIEQVRHKFHPGVSEEVDLNLSFDALDLMATFKGQPHQVLIDELAFSVWRYAYDLGIPDKNEVASEWAIQFCRDKPLNGCAGTVAEFQGPILADRAWSSTLRKARTALRACTSCDKRQQTRLEAAERLENDFDQFARRAREVGHPKHWPIYNGSLPAWSLGEAVRLSESGAVTIKGRAYRQKIGQVLPRPKENNPWLGMHCEPDTEIRHIRSLASVAREVGYRGLAVQVRGPDYPYVLFELRVDQDVIKQSPLKDGDSVQGLVEDIRYRVQS